MTHFSVGDVVPGSLVTGVLKETVYCNHNDKKKENSWDQEVFLAIWHNLLVDVVESYEEAERIVRTFSQGELYLLYRELFEGRNEYRYKFRAVVDWVKKYFKYEGLSIEEKERLLNDERIKVWDLDMKWFAEKMQDFKEPFKDFLKELEQRKNFDWFGFL